MTEGILSGYRIMWLYVFFDLPVTLKRERDRATRFRKNLLDLGFEMVQFSVYTRHCSGKERIDALTSKVKDFVPKEGKVDMLAITDRQFSNIVSIRGIDSKKQPKKPTQLALF